MNHVMISRTDAIGDVILTLPLAGIIKAHFPDCKVSFLGNSYTKDVVSAFTPVDEFINYDEFAVLSDDKAAHNLKSLSIDAIIHVLPNRRVATQARMAGIKTRVATTNRLYHWFTCNKLIRLSRKNSDLHEAQLNAKLLAAIHIPSQFSMDQLWRYYKWQFEPLKEEHQAFLGKDKFNLILHTKSRGSGQEWSLDNYEALISSLDLNRVKVLITGSENEGIILKDWIKKLTGKVTDLTGKFTLKEFISFISHADGLLASGTGPLHIAAASGINALGLFPDKKPIYAKRWAPLGEKAIYLQSLDEDVNAISPEQVNSEILKWIK